MGNSLIHENPQGPKLTKTKNDNMHTSTEKEENKFSLQIQFIKIANTQFNGEAISKLLVVCPHQVITVSYFGENYSIDSFFREDESLTQEPINKTNEIVKIEITEDI